MKLLKHPLMLHSPHTGWYKQKSNRNTEIRGLRRRKQILQFYRDPYQLSKGHEACYVALTTEWGFRNGRIPFPLCPQWVASYWQTVNKSWGWLSAVRGCWIWHCCTTLFIFTWSICLTVWFSFFFFLFLHHHNFDLAVGPVHAIFHKQILCEPASFSLYISHLSVIHSVSWHWKFISFVPWCCIIRRLTRIIIVI